MRSVLVAVLLLPCAAHAERPWAVSAAAGAALPIPSNRVTTRGTVDLALERTVWGRLGIELGARLGLAEIATDLSVMAGASLRLAQWRRLRLRARGGLGYAAIRVDKLGHTLWTEALVLSSGVELSHSIGQRLELRFAPLSFSFYYNALWIPSWEPGAGRARRV